MTTDVEQLGEDYRRQRERVVAGLLTEPPGRPQVSEHGGDLRSAVSVGAGDPRRSGDFRDLLHVL